jgi:hypothetical protein
VPRHQIADVAGEGKDMKSQDGEAGNMCRQENIQHQILFARISHLKSAKTPYVLIANTLI